MEEGHLAVAEEVLVDHVAELTATPRELVLRCLLARTVASGGREVIEKGHTAAEASYARDACAKVLWGQVVWGGTQEAFLEEAGPEAARSSPGSPQAVYQRLFEWVVNRINSVMEARDRDPRRDGKDTVIGVLDIYGFEVFPVNRWGGPALTPSLQGGLGWLGSGVSGACPAGLPAPGSCPSGAQEGQVLSSLPLTVSPPVAGGRGRG